MAHSENLPERNAPPSPVPTSLRIWGTLLRTAFLCILLVLVARVAMPQSETIWSSYETPNDLIRLILGVVVCIWMVYLMFRGPKDASGFRAWFYIGLVGVPFALVCLVYIW